ncbi:MAG: AarF/ABC1/UbiB kinase family protein [Phycicoccus sp.]|nr:AarF/ABC1/UbiB kinase family protein [Phycicoccus sp.]
MTEIPRTALTRAARLASLPLSHAGRTAVGLGKRVGGKSAEAVAAEIQLRTAEQMFSVLGQLKGGAMKFGQALSVLEAAMPEEVVAPYRATLTKLQEAGPPLPAKTVHAVLARELGPRWRSAKFVEFDDQPVAAASIGQVHRAIWRDGREVAVKIQYPGAGPALLSDLTQISRLARMAGAVMPGIDVKPITDELVARMSEELDYTSEARHQRAFARAFRGDDDVLVPDVLAESGHVLVSEWVPGTPLSQIIASGTPEQRDEAAALYLEFLLRGPNRARLLHADPHPGNFRLTPDGRLGVLDFGAVDRLPAGLPRAIGELVTEALSGQAEPFAAGLAAEGFVRPGTQVEPEALRRYLVRFLEPITHAQFRIDRPWLRTVAASIRDPRTPDFLVGTKLNLPPDYLLIHRVWLGGIGVLAQIGGTIPVREILVAHLPGLDESRLPPPLA